MTTKIIKVPATDWDLLHEQKHVLLKTIWDNEDSPLWGLVNWIDSIQDLAVAAGEWEFPPDPDDEEDA
jgi:hypothetical protein